MALDTFNPYLFVSSGEQSNKFLTPTITNGIAQFQAQRAQSITGLTVRIDPIQSGSGDPSPDNIRPISGRTGMTVTRAGRNIVQISDVDIPANVSQILPISEYVTLAAGTYTLSWTFTGNVTQTRNQPEYNVSNVGHIYSGVNCTTSGRYSWTFTLTEETTLQFGWWYHTVSAACSVTDFMLEFGDTAHEYAPYVAPTTYPISWETEAGTVYGGTLDVVSGELIVTHGLVAFDGSENWILGRDSTEGCYVQLNSLVKTNNYIGKILCDKLSTFSLYHNDAYQSAEYGITAYPAGTTYPNQNWIYAKNERTPTVESFKAWLSENPITICYYLATPQTYRLTGADVRTIAGFNQIYSDEGPVIDIKF